jgi:NAD(P)H-dependent FMN reductase
MKILAIMGSPKGKGAGLRITKQIEAMMQRLGEVEFDYLFLKDQELQPCRGCFLCVTQGEDRCPLDDDRRPIERRIEAADGVILVSPSYVSNVTWLVKNFIDRLCYTNHRPKFFRQKLMLVSNAGAGMDKTIEALRLALGPGPEIVSELACLTPPWPLRATVRDKQRRKMEKATRTFYRAIKRDELRGGLPLKPSFSDYLRFRFFKKISSDTKAYLTADYEYYSARDQYYHDAKISPMMRAGASLVLAVSMFLMRDLAPDEAA